MDPHANGPCHRLKVLFPKKGTRVAHWCGGFGRYSKMIEAAGRYSQGAFEALVGMGARAGRVERPIAVALEALGVQLRHGEQLNPAEARHVIELVRATLEVCVRAAPEQLEA